MRLWARTLSRCQALFAAWAFGGDDVGGEFPLELGRVHVLGLRSRPITAFMSAIPLHGTAKDRGVRYPFSSFFSSLTKRQSVPWAMIFFGSLLISPNSRSRSA